MNGAKTPRSLRANTLNFVREKFDSYSGRKVSAVAGLMAVASFSGAEAQSNLPPVTVDAPSRARVPPFPSRPPPRPAPAMPCGARRVGRNKRQAAPVPFPNAGGLSADRDPYADAAAPYKVDHVQSSGKFPEPLLNTPKTITVLSKEVLADENATTLKQALLNTAGVTLGTGEGGNAFGDRFFIRGFDTRNDIFVDGVRDPGVSVRENFFTEQIEILRGPGSSFAGRGTTGGAINIVTKKATTEHSFYNMDETIGTEPSERLTLDVNQVISPTFRCAPAACSRTPLSPSRTMSRRITAAVSSRARGRRSMPSSSPRTMFTPMSTDCQTSACRITGRERLERPWAEAI